MANETLVGTPVEMERLARARRGTREHLGCPKWDQKARKLCRLPFEVPWVKQIQFVNSMIATLTASFAVVRFAYRAAFAKMRAGGLLDMPSFKVGASAALRRTLRLSAPQTLEATELATYKELADFLAEVERRAFKQAMFAVRDDATALDIVQDAMMKLSEKYPDRPPAELPLLFQRILQNTIRDFYRRQKVRSMWTTPISSLINEDSDGDHDPLETLEVENESPYSAPPLQQLERAQVLAFIEKSLTKLPARQREAFILRYWEEMDVAEAAKAMGCSEGSVKTHCSRATHALAESLKKLGITL